MGSVNDVKGRVVAITGGGRGIGLSTAQALRAAGARVAIGDVDGKAVTAAADRLGIGSGHGPIHHFHRFY